MNKHVDHLYVLPEDDANRQIADGFVLHHEVHDLRIKVVPPVGGWAKVLKTFSDEYAALLRSFPHAHLVMLIDFDDHVQQRREDFENAIPEELKSRVFVLGSKFEPEVLRQVLGRSYEAIGFDLADECARGTLQLWVHEHLVNNEADRVRLLQAVHPFLLGAA